MLRVDMFSNEKTKQPKSGWFFIAMKFKRKLLACRLTLYEYVHDKMHTHKWNNKLFLAEMEGINVQFLFINLYATPTNQRLEKLNGSACMRNEFRSWKAVNNGNWLMILCTSFGQCVSVSSLFCLKCFIHFLHSYNSLMVYFLCIQNTIT